MTELLTEKDLRKRLSVSRNMVWNWRKKGMPFLRIGYRTVRYNYEEVLHWILEQFSSISKKNE